MRKIFVLIKNEFKKLFARKSTVAMLIIICFLAFISICVSINSGGIIYEGVEYINEDYIRSEAEWIEQEYNQMNAEGEYLHQDDYAYEMRALAKSYRFMLQIGLDNAYDWRYKMIYEDMTSLFKEIDMGKGTAKTEAMISEMKDMASRDDWKAYYDKIKSSIMSAEGISDIRKEAYAFEYNYYLENDLKPGTVSWKDSLIDKAASAKQSLAPYLEAEKNGEKVDPKVTEKYRNTLAVALYQLDNDVQYNAKVYLEGTENDDTYWSCFTRTNWLLTVIGIMMIVIAGRIVAQEFSSGTIKFLLISPVKRYKILLAKYITVLLMGFIMMSILYVTSAVLALPLSLGKGITSMVVEANDGVVKATSPLLGMIAHYALQSVGMIVMATMAFAVSALMRSTTLSVGIGVSAYSFGVLFSSILALMEVDIGRYLIFSNLDLAGIANGEAMFKYQTLPLALIIIGIHMIVFLLTAYDAFVKRDI